MGRFARRALRRLAGEQAGMTVVEVVVAGMILVIGSVGVFGMVDAATRSTFRAEQSQTLNNVLQREVEKLREMPYDELALSSLPSHESGENNPNSRVSGSEFMTRRSGAVPRTLLLEGAVNPGPEPFEVEDVKGTIYRYVVRDAEFLKRVIVVAKLDATASGGAGRRYQEIQSQIVDPEAKAVESPGPTPGGATVTTWPLWLTDTTCDAEVPVPASEREDHLAHNTRGDCGDGMKTGNEPGAPDLLWLEAPELADESPVHDYATDVEPEVEPDRDKGLQIMLGAECGAMPATEVRTEADADATMFQQLHKWVTPPIDSADLALTGEGTLSIWTQSIEHGVYPVTVCIWLLVREEGADTALPQVLESLPYTTYSKSSWPSTGWVQLTIPLEFRNPDGSGGEIPLAEGSRIGLAISVKAGENTSGIQTLYDEPSFDSRLSLDTTGTLPEWP